MYLDLPLRARCAFNSFIIFQLLDVSAVFGHVVVDSSMQQLESFFQWLLAKLRRVRAGVVQRYVAVGGKAKSGGFADPM